MTDARPPLVAELVWSGDLRFDASCGAHTVVVDGDSRHGPSRRSMPPWGSPGAWPLMSSTFCAKAVIR
jgi:hypothetical protein